MPTPLASGVIQDSDTHTCLLLFASHPQILPPAPPRLLTIWFGANDACIPPSPQHVPLPRFEDNLRAMIHAAPKATHVLLLTPPPVNTHQRGADLASRDPPKELDRLFNVTKAYADAVKTVGAAEKVPVADVWTALWNAAGCDEAALSRFLIDGLHLNEAGYQVRAVDRVRLERLQRDNTIGRVHRVSECDRGQLARFAARA
jgi:lysophospholipase L1-like esterase